MNNIFNFGGMNIPPITHQTTLSSLYKILNSGYLLSRKESGVERGLSADNKGDPNFIYLSLSTETPLLGEVKIYIKSNILVDRKDYYLNTGWNYGINANTLPSDKLLDWLSMVGIFGEILFQNSINIDEYLDKIVVTKLPDDIIKIIARQDPKIYDKIINHSMIPEKYHKFLVIVE